MIGGEVGKRRPYLGGCHDRSRFVLIVVLVLAFEANARKTDLSINDDSRSAFLVEPFCFDDGGQLQLSVEDFTQRQNGLDLQQPIGVGFLIRKTDNPQAAYNPAAVTEFLTGCLLSKDYMLVDDHRVMMQDSGLNYSLSLQEQGPGLYTVIYANCAEGTTASFKLTMTLTNKGGQMLSAGNIPLPICFAIFTLAFGIALIVWVAVIMRNRESAHRIHVLMAVLCGVKMISAALEGLRYESIKRTGDGGGWTHASYAFAGIRGVMFFSVVLLVGTGWSFVKPFLSARDTRILMIVVPMQVVVNIASIIVEEMSPGTMGWLTWRDVLHLFDIVCCCAILFPIVWSIRNLKEAAMADDKAARTLRKLKLFREFYIMVVAYIYFTRIAVFIVQNTLPCGQSYIAASLSELATLVFFTVSGYKFRPMPHNPYFQVDDSDGGGAAGPDSATDVELVPRAGPRAGHPDLE